MWTKSYQLEDHQSFQPKVTSLHNYLSEKHDFKGSSFLTCFQNYLHNRKSAVEDQLNYTEGKR